MKLIIASNNKHKIREIKEILGAEFDEILSVREAGIEHDTVEDGSTFLENAEKKAREIAEISACPALADDSGICAHALDGAPDIYSARYSGEAGGHGDDEANNDLLLKNLEGKSDRGAHYTCAMVLAYPDGRKISAEGYLYGSIIKERRGNGGFGYDPLFMPLGESRTVAEMTDDEKNKISHRGNALRAVLAKLQKGEFDK